MKASPAQSRLDVLLAERADVWRGRGAEAKTAEVGLPTGFARLDRALLHGGWPTAGLCEILTDMPGAGLSLILPALIALSERRPWLLMAAPPLLPYAPALAACGLDVGRMLVVTGHQECAWVMEQGLRDGSCAAVIGWMDRMTAAQLRRLQLAALESQTLVFLFRSSAQTEQASPARLRLRLRSTADGAREAVLLKQRGGVASRAFRL